MTAGLLLTDPVALGPYRLLGRLGGGGMGQVFLAQSPRGLAAVKVIRPELAADTEFRTRFAREVAAARKVSGAYTAALIDADTEGAVPWLATAYIAGPSLSAAVRDIGPLPPASLRPLAAGLVEALRAIHAAGVVHRDLKPSNVLLADDGPRVIDFGISHAVEASTVTQSGAILGSPGYMSPEQAQGHRVGPASDVFSLGALLAYAATGAGPFGDGSVAALVYRVVNVEPDLDRVPAEFSPLIERCLAKAPDERPGLGDLLSELGGEPIRENWLPAAVTSTLLRYAPSARIAAMPVPEPPRAEAWATETVAPEKPAPETSAPGTPARETPAGGGIAPPARRRRQVKRRQQGAVIAVAVIAVVAGVASWLAPGTGGSRSQSDPAAMLMTRPASSAGTSTAAKGSHAKNPGQHGSSAPPVTSRKPTPPPSPAPAVTVRPPAPTVSQSQAPPQSPAPSPVPSASHIGGVSIGDDSSAIVTSEVSIAFGGCTAWLDNDGSGNLSGTLNTSLYQSCEAEVYLSGGPAVSLSASWGAERTSALSDAGHTMWICVWQPGAQAGQQCSPPFAVNGDTPTQT